MCVTKPGMCLLEAKFRISTCFQVFRLLSQTTLKKWIDHIISALIPWFSILNHIYIYLPRERFSIIYFLYLSEQVGVNAPGTATRTTWSGKEKKREKLGHGIILWSKEHTGNDHANKINDKEKNQRHRHWRRSFSRISHSFNLCFFFFFSFPS